MELKIETDIKPSRIESAVVRAEFDKAKEILESNGYRIISLEENAELRMHEGKYHNVSKKGNLTREGCIFFPGRKPRSVLVRNSPILNFAGEAVRNSREFKEFYPTKECIEQSLVDSVVYPDRSTCMPTNRFDSEELTIWAFGGEKKAQDYGDFLRSLGIKNMSVTAPYLNDPTLNKNGLSKYPYACQVYFGRIYYDDDSDCFGGSYIRPDTLSMFMHQETLSLLRGIKEV